MKGKGTANVAQAGNAGNKQTGLPRPPHDMSLQGALQP